MSLFQCCLIREIVPDSCMKIVASHVVTVYAVTMNFYFYYTSFFSSEHWYSILLYHTFVCLFPITICQLLKSQHICLHHSKIFRKTLLPRIENQEKESFFKVFLKFGNSVTDTCDNVVILLVNTIKLLIE